MYDPKILRAVEKRLDAKLKQQVREGLAEGFTQLSCKDVANEIRKGRDVSGNVEYGVMHCVHDKLGPRVDPSTLEFSPQPRKARDLEHRFIGMVNKTLEMGGYPQIDQAKVLRELRSKDRAFEKMVAKQRRKR